MEYDSSRYKRYISIGFGIKLNIYKALYPKKYFTIFIKMVKLKTIFIYFYPIKTTESIWSEIQRNPLIFFFSECIFFVK